MTPAQIKLQAIKFKRIRTMRTANPFCATCGERRWWVRYELHHIAGRKYSEELIRLCLNCHDWISMMQKFIPPMPEGGDPRRATLIATHEGVALLLDLSAATHREMADILRGVPGILPAAADSEAGE